MARASSNDESTPKGIHDSQPRRNIVGDYPERPYGEAISKEHRTVLEEAGFETEQAAVSVATSDPK